MFEISDAPKLSEYLTENQQKNNYSILYTLCLTFMPLCFSLCLLQTFLVYVFICLNWNWNDVNV